jgi:hypothetical protein
VLLACADDVGLDTRAFAVLLDADAGVSGLAADLEETRALGVRAFPTLFLAGRTGTVRVLTGTRPYRALESALFDTLGGDTPQPDRPPTAAEALRSYGSGTLLEFATLMELGAETTAAELAAAGASRRALGAVEYWVTSGKGAANPSRTVAG